MNYRHGFHAGNFADVLKHVMLTRILLHLRAKPAAFRVIDTHAGAGRYDLSSDEASRGGEWQAGIARLRAAPLQPPAQALIEPYLGLVAALNPPQVLAAYPGSPAVVRAMLRTRDRLVACELEPGAFAALEHNFRRDRRIKCVEIDGWTALNACVPPKERRGVVLIDPPFEDADEFSRLAEAIEGAHRKWPTGIYLAWYPIKQRKAADAFIRRLARGGIGRLLRVELSIAASSADRLSACGLVAINPPWTLQSELEALLPALAQALGGPDGRGSVAVLGGEK